MQLPVKGKEYSLYQPIMGIETETVQFHSLLYAHSGWRKAFEGFALFLGNPYQKEDGHQSESMLMIFHSIIKSAYMGLHTKAACD